MDRNKRVIKLKILGRPSYNKWTLHQWVLEIKDILENEYNIHLEIEVVDTIDEEPILMIEDDIVLEGLPGEEGYLIEIIKHNLDKLLVKEKNKDEE
ncbi:MAG: hypothetical protein DRO16_01770 [Thermoprotei archaeon]|nr:MAG: hypothetical protein DRO16_01770 [Thermoprotei archaeon]